MVEGYIPKGGAAQADEHSGTKPNNITENIVSPIIHKTTTRLITESHLIVLDEQINCIHCNSEVMVVGRLQLETGGNCPYADHKVCQSCFL